MHRKSQPRAASGQRHSFLLAIAAGAVGVLLAQQPEPAAAQTTQAPEQVFNIDLPAQPLAQALAALSRQTGVQVFAAGELVSGFRAPAVRGSLSPKQALEQLLAGSGLTSALQGGAFVVKPGLTRSAAPAPAPAAAMSVTEATLETVVVTGERAPRSLAETTSSVTVLPEAEVRRRSGKEGVFQAIDGAPNYTPSTPEELPVIRGERSSGPSSLGGGFLFGSTTRASLIVDDVARISAISNNSFQSIFDVQQVELLRGPQTTVRGANAIAGAYVVKTKDPSSKPEGELFTMLEWNAFSGTGWRAAAMGNAPVGEAMAARVVVERRSGRVPVKIIDASGFDASQAVPPPGTDLAALSDFNNTALRAKLLIAPPGVPQLDVLLSFQHEQGLDVGFDSYANGELVHGRPLRERKYVFGQQRIFDTRAQAFSVNAGWQFDGGGELRMIASTQKDHFDDNPRANQAVRFKQFDESLTTLDLLYKYGRNKSAMQGLVGATLSRRKQDGETTGFALTNRQRASSRAVFADVSVPFAEGWTLLAGSRVQFEDGSRFFDFAGLASVDDRINETVFLPKLGASVEINGAQTAALTWRRGYNPGGSGVDFASLETFRFGSEKVDTVELAWRYAPQGGAASLSANLFYNDFDDKQFQFNPTPTSARIVNEPKSRSYGLEIEGSLQLTPSLRASAALGLLHTRITRGDPALVGNRFGEDPNSTLSLAAVWTPLPDLELNARVNHVGGYYADFQNAATDRGGDYTVLDLGATRVTGAWTLRAFLNNATNTFAVGRGSAYGGYLLPPRVAGVSASLKF